VHHTYSMNESAIAGGRKVSLPPFSGVSVNKVRGVSWVRQFGLRGDANASYWIEIGCLGVTTGSNKQWVQKLGKRN
jgi:hypothetical protein